MGPMCPLLDAPGEPYEVVKGLSGTMTVKFKAEKERGLPQLGLKASSYSNAHVEYPELDWFPQTTKVWYPFPFAHLRKYYNQAGLCKRQDLQEEGA